MNINQAPGNTVFVGGAVRNPSAVPIPAANNMEQAILGAGGILPVGETPAAWRSCARTRKAAITPTSSTSAS